MATSRITYADKADGDKFFATDATMVKNVVNPIGVATDQNTVDIESINEGLTAANETISNQALAIQSNEDGINQINESKGQPSGIATLGNDGKVPTAQLPASGGGTSITFNPKDYGALGNNTANDTAGIQAAIDAAHAVKGKVLIPQGVYLVDQLNWYPDVEMSGIGLKGTILKSRSSVPMFYYHIDVSIDQPSASFSDMYLDGNNIGTIAIDKKGVYHTYFSKIIFSNFTTKLVNSTACVADVYSRVTFQNSPLGITLNYDNVLLQPNLNIFRDCLFQSLTTWAITMDKGAGLMINDCDFEVNGTSGNLNTGCINLTNNCPYSEGVLMSMNNTWFERNNGTEVMIGTQLNPPLSGSGFQVNISNTILQFPNNTPGGVNTTVRGVVVNGGNLNLYNTTIKGYTLSGVSNELTTNNASVTTAFGCAIAAHVENNSGKFIAIDLTKYINNQDVDQNYNPFQPGTGSKIDYFLRTSKYLTADQYLQSLDLKLTGDILLDRGQGNGGRIGTATLVNGTITLNNAYAANPTTYPNGQVFLTYNTIAGSPGVLTYSRSGNNLTITSTSNTDNSIVNWVIFN